MDSGSVSKTFLGGSTFLSIWGSQLAHAGQQSAEPSSGLKDRADAGEVRTDAAALWLGTRDERKMLGSSIYEGPVMNASASKTVSFL